MANYYTIWVDENSSTHTLTAANMNSRLTELDDQIFINETAIAAITGYTSAQMLVDLKANDGAGSGVDADTVDNSHLADIVDAAGGGNDYSYPNRVAGKNSTGDETIGSTTNAQGLCIDSVGDVWIGLHNSADWKMMIRRYNSRDLSNSDDYEPGVASYKVVDLVAHGEYVYALLAAPTVDGWAGTVVAPGTQGKVARVKISDGTLDTSWGASGIVNLVDGGGSPVADPWAMVCDETYLFIACLTDPGTVVRVTLSSAACTGQAWGANYRYATSVGILTDTLGSHKVVCGFHAVTTGQTYGSFGICTTALATLVYRDIDGTECDGGTATDMFQVERIMTAPGTMLATLGSGTDALTIAFDMMDYAGTGTSLKYSLFVLPSGGSLATARGLALAPDGVAYVNDPAANGHLARFASFGCSRSSFAGIGYLAAGATNVINHLLHDGRAVWYVGNDGTNALVGKWAA
ncbi:MAG: hypothetical protein GY700_06380 [Propionibacteriaceae bacterium]|nr:hypothetical protein [Propionibacteriaceae bacterium]